MSARNVHRSDWMRSLRRAQLNRRHRQGRQNNLSNCCIEKHVHSRRYIVLTQKLTGVNIETTGRLVQLAARWRIERPDTACSTLCLQWHHWRVPWQSIAVSMIYRQSVRSLAFSRLSGPRCWLIVHQYQSPSASWYVGVHKVSSNDRVVGATPQWPGDDHV